MSNCIDQIYCENSSECIITVTDLNGNPIDPQYINTHDSVIFVLGDKPGYTFEGWCDEDNVDVPYSTTNTDGTQLPPNHYRIDDIDCSKEYYAKYAPIDYYITQTSNSTGVCFEDVTTIAHYGDIVVISAQEGFGCHFINWTKDGYVVSEEPSFEYVVTSSATFRANYDSMWLRITAKPNNPNRGACTGSGNYVINDTATITAIPNQGYAFGGWTDNSLLNPRNVTVRGNMTYVATFYRNNNVVTAVPSLGGHTIGSGSYMTGQVVKLQPIANTGWVFSHWLVNGTERVDNEIYSFVCVEDVDVEPIFEKASYEVNVDVSPSGYGHINPIVTGMYGYGEQITFEAVPNNDTNFVAWDDNVLSPVRSLTVTSNIDITAIFVDKPSVVTTTIILPSGKYSCQVIYEGADIGVQDHNQVVAEAIENAVVTLVPANMTGKTLQMILDENDVVIWTNTDKQPIAYNVGNEDKTLTVVYVDTEYVLSVGAEPMNNSMSGQISIDVSINSTSYVFTPTIGEPYMEYGENVYGTSATISTPVSINGYVFSYWATDVGTFGENTINVALTKNITCVAVYEPFQNT